MAFNAFKPKLLPFCFDENGKYNYEVITPELVQNCTDFDSSYFKKLPLARIQPHEVEEMRRKYDGIPDVAWTLVKSWTKDPRLCSDAVARRRGYLTAQLSNVSPSSPSSSSSSSSSSRVKRPTAATLKSEGSDSSESAAEQKEQGRDRSSSKKRKGSSSSSSSNTGSVKKAKKNPRS